jgi:hypothetical protein
VNALIELATGHPILLWVFGGSILAALMAVLGGIRDFLLSIGRGLAALATAPHRHRMEELRARAELARAEQQAAPAVTPGEKKPGSCVHRNVTAIIPANEDTPVGWLCRCGERLPATWAVLEEDL